MSSLFDYLDDFEGWSEEDYDENQIAVEVFYDYRVPDDRAPDKLE